MISKLLIAFGIIIVGVSAASAQSCQDVINTRQTLMKKSGQAGKDAFAMIKGQAPFDLAKANEILATFANDAEKMPTLFPDCSKTGEHTTAAPAIWDKSADFKAAMAKFAADVKAAQDGTKDPATFKTGIDTISKNCSSCHQQFRVRAS
jgi:cytochrome c556